MVWKGRGEEAEVVEECAPSSDMATPTETHSSGADEAAPSPLYSARIEGLSELRTKFDNQLEFDVESSKFSWTEVSAANKNFKHSDVQVPNSVVFEEMKQHPEWGPFFRRQPYELEMGAKIAEGGQAEIFEALGWNKYDAKCVEKNEKISLVVKVFKQEFSLADLQRLWPPGIALAAIPYRYFGCAQSTVIPSDYLCWAVGANVMDDGRFAFIFHKHWGDLRKLINENMMKWNECPPFSGLTTFTYILSIAKGMYNLHKLGILHRDLKAANVMVLNRAWGISAVADFESSVGILGTGFWRAPEVLLALKNGNFNQETFTQQADVYSFAMTCYEVITGHMPFEGHNQHDYDIVLRGERPTLPSELPYSMLNDLVTKCWHQDPSQRPSFGEILKDLEVLRSSDWSKFNSKFLATRNERKASGVEDCEPLSRAFINGNPMFPH